MPGRSSTKEERAAYLREWNAKNPGYAYEQSRKWRLANQEKHAAGTKRWREANRADVLQKKKIYYQKNKAKHVDGSRRSSLKRIYRITLEERDAMLVAQGGACPICRDTTPRSKRGWVVDHDHKTGNTRGVLCNHCNVGIGFLRDDAEVLQRAIEYLDKFKCEVTPEVAQETT